MKGAATKLALLEGSYALPLGIATPATVVVAPGAALPSSSGMYWLNPVGSAAMPRLPMVLLAVKAALIIPAAEP